jgi:hypothetical protein
MYRLSLLRESNASKGHDWMDALASAELSCVAADGTHVDITIGVGRPYRAAGGEWRCPLSIDGLERKLPDMAGEDSLQALCMALSVARGVLEHLIETGGQLVHRVDRTPYDVDATFGRVARG